MEVQNTEIEGVQILKPVVHRDNRGEFTELFNFDGHNFFNSAIYQVSRSISTRCVFRGLHFQPHMAKTMRVVKGSALIYNVDLRVDSPTFLQCVEVLLTDKTPTAMVFAPSWCARGFFALENRTEIEYFHDDTFDPEKSFAIRWNDPQLDIVIPHMAPILSKNDQTAMSVEEWLGRPEAQTLPFKGMIWN